MKHLEPDEIAAAAEPGRADLPPHLARCRRCADDVALLGRALRAARADREPPPATLARAHDLMPRRGILDAAVASVRRVLAALVTDSGSLAPAIAGVRGAAPERRQILYRADGFDIDLSHPIASGLIDLYGQVLAAQGAAEPLAARPVTLVATNRPPLTTATDPFGSFRFAAIPPGDYRIEVEFADRDLVIPFALPGTPEGPAAGG